MNGLQYKSVPFLDVKAEGDGSEFEGWAAAFYNLDGVGDIIAPGAFVATIPFLLSSGVVCYEHCQTIGKPLAAREDAKGLFVKGRISATSLGNDVKTLLRDDVVRKLSIGYRTLKGGARRMTSDETKAYWSSAGYQPTDEDLANLDAFGDWGIRLLTAVKVYEFSPVGFPANVAASITGVKSGPPRLSQIRELARWARTQVKAGKVLSGKNRERLCSVRDGLKAAHSELDDLLETTAPGPSPDAQGDPDDDATKALARRVETAKAMLCLHKTAL